MIFSFKKQFGLLVLLLGSLCHASFAADLMSAANDELDQSVEDVPVELIQQFVEIYGLVKDNYVIERNDDQLFNFAISGMVSGLDRYSRFLSPEDFKQLIQYTEGELASVDFNVQYNNSLKQWVIQGLKADSDSAQFGFRNGVSVFKIDGQELSALNQDQVKYLLTGSIGSPVTVQLTESGQVFNLIRNKKIETNISAKLLKNQVLVLSVSVFQQDTANEIKRLIEEYTSAAKVSAVMLDLRNNPGGLLSSAVETADLFLNQGIIVSTKSRSEGEQQFQALPSLEFENLKLGILINRRSASAAEVFTAALKDHRRAWVIGEKSYGKGVVQKLFPVNNGAAIQMTVAQYFTPKGEMIEGIGIQPNQNYPLPLNMSDDTYIENVANILLSRK